MLELNKKYKAKYVKNDNNLFFYIDNNLVQSPSTVSNRIVDSSFYLFKSGNDFGRIKLYNAELYSGDTLIRNFVPVIRKSDNKPGLLDLANRTNNLFDKNKAIANKQYNNQGQLITPQEAGIWYASDFIEVEEGKTYIRSSNGTANGNYYNIYDENKTFIEHIAAGNGMPFTIGTGVRYITFAINTDNTPLNTFQLNEGTTALSYEPYGYKFYTNDGENEFITGPEI